MKFSEKKTQALLALYEKKFDGKYYNITKMLGDWGISVSWEESYQIGRALEDEGYVNLAASKDSVSGFITGEGVEFVEEYDFFNNDEYETDFSEDERIVLNLRLDNLFAELEKLQIGQQIIYDDLSKEIEELKGLMNKLNKKNWLEVLQGKLITIGLGKLTEHGLKLISTTLGSTNQIG